MKKKKLHQRFVVTFMIACLALLLPGTKVFADTNPLCFTANSAETEITFTLRTGFSGTVEYSTDNSNWIPYTSGTKITLTNKGDKVYFRSTNATTAYGGYSDKRSSMFKSSKQTIVSGNVMSLYNYAEDIPYDSAFAYMFKASNIKTCPELPSKSLKKYCYKAMFYDCNNITEAPSLPATTLTEGCYNVMFVNCLHLTNLPILPATKLEKNCYQGMFKNCTAITTALELPATIIAENCYNEMFSGCSSLTNAPELPALTLQRQCYAKMFYGCTSLKSIPELPATTMGTNSYQNMFQNCSTLVINTSAPGKQWSVNCTITSQSMFSGTAGDLKGDPVSGTKYYIASGADKTTSSDGNWDNASSWDAGVPNGADDVTINNAITIPSGVNAYCNTLTIGTGSLTIAPDATLHATTINNTDASKLILQADENNSVATVRFTDTNCQPKATVQMYFRGTTSGPDANDKYSPEWQYRGFIGNPDETQAQFGTDEDNFANIVIYKWNEQSSTNDCWEAFYGGSLGYNYASGESFNGETWNGFSMANYNAAGITKSYTTTLIPTSQDHTYSLTRTTARSGLESTDEVKNKGVNQITNSFSAPINIASLSSSNFDSGIENTLYLFNTGTNASESAFITVPISTASTLANNIIPAGQSFLVWAQTAAGNFTVPAAAVSTTTSPAMYAPRKETRFGVLKIEAESENGFDDLYLLTNDNCSAEFDNGYDGSKMFSSKAHQIYAQNEYGTTAVNADRTLLGQYVGFRPLNGSKESITFTITTRDLDDYEELYLYDHETGTYTDLMDGEATYTFNAPSTENAKRFQIVGKATDGTSFNPTEAQRIDIAGGEVWLTNFDRSDAQVIMTDAAGRTIWSVNAKEGTHFTLPEVAAGVYFISCGKTTTKYIPQTR